jgi:hypothetical protein
MKINLANCKLTDEFISFIENNELHSSIPYLKLHFDWSKIEPKINCTHTKPLIPTKTHNKKYK